MEASSKSASGPRGVVVTHPLCAQTALGSVPSARGRARGWSRGRGPVPRDQQGARSPSTQHKIANPAAYSPSRYGDDSLMQVMTMTMAAVVVMRMAAMTPALVQRAISAAYRAK